MPEPHLREPHECLDYTYAGGTCRHGWRLVLDGPGKSRAVPPERREVLTVQPDTTCPCQAHAFARWVCGDTEWKKVEITVIITSNPCTQEPKP